MYHRITLWLKFLILLWLLTSCDLSSNVAPTSQPASQTTNTNPSRPYPLPSGRPYPLATIPTALKTPVPPAAPPQPASGKASLAGVVYSPRMSMVLPQTQFYLTLGVGENNREIPPILIGPQETKGDIKAITDTKGQFVLKDIQPNNYYLIVWAPTYWIPAINSNIDPTPRLIQLQPNQQVQLGVVTVPWP
jgi:hypothetical protein